MAASRPGSQGALITWLVILAILFVTATIFAFIFQADARRNADSVTTLTGKYRDIITDSEMSGQDVVDLREARSDVRFNASSSTPVLNVAVEQRKLLARTITGNPIAAGAAKDQADRAMADAVTALKAAGISETPASDNLIVALNEVVKIAQGQRGQFVKVQADLAAAKAETLAAIKRADDQAAEHETALAEVRDATAKEIAMATENANASVSSVEGIQKNVTAERDSQTAAYDKLLLDSQAKDVTITDKDKQIAILQTKLAGLRVDTKNAVVRQADGQIIRIPSSSTVYVDLGAGDQVTPGLTFEVYDKNDGVPGIASTDETSMPAGKASIEITRVGATSSEARIIKTRPGYQLTEGDVLGNLVYDPNTKYNFIVFGNFDLDQNGVAVPGDAEVIKRLVTQWGAKIATDVNVDTDFVVLGKEPVVPDFTPEQLQDPEVRARKQAIEGEVEAFNAVKDKARELHIPVLNQNRFLYFIGYYDLARR